MNGKSTWIWIGIAVSLFAFIFFFERHRHQAPAGPQRVLPNLKAASVRSIQVRPSGPISLEIRASRTNGVWRLTEPIVYPADSSSIEALLAALEALTPATYISTAELKRHTNSDEEYGFTAPEATVTLQQDRGDYVYLRLGSKTAPGDQVFLQAGPEGVYVVDAELLRLIPGSANDWRDTTLIGPDGPAFERVAVTNNAKVFVVQREGPDKLWRMVWPFTKGARADNTRIEESLRKLQELRVRQFVSDDPKPDLESIGLAPPDLELALGQGTNALVHFQFGRNPTNDANVLYARRVGQNAVFTVPKDLVAPWRTASVNEFRDPYLLTLDEPVEWAEVHARDAFSIQLQTNGAWRVLAENCPEYAADPGLVKEFLSLLTDLKIVDFVKDVVNPPELPDFGLAAPFCQYVLRGAALTNSPADTNRVIADLSFGISTNEPTKVFARRSDETPVYAVSASDFARLPLASWQFRERKLWKVSAEEVSGVTIHQRGRLRQLIRKGTHQWSLAPGSQGIINDLAIEETVRGLIQASASSWIGRGRESRRQFGFADDGLQITIILKNSDKLNIEFAASGSPNIPLAAVTLDGQPWILEFPWVVYRDVETYLSVPEHP